MAHERADEAKIEDSEITTGSVLVPEPPPSSHDLSSVDHLLALTDEGWEIDEQVKTLKQAAFTKPIAEAAPPKQAPGKLHLPTPYELAPTIVAVPSPGGAAMVPPSAREPAKPGQSSPPDSSSRPPPLPPSARDLKPASRRPPPPLPSSKKSPAAVPIVRTPEPPSARERSSASPTSDLAQHGTLVDLLNARLSTLEDKDDKVGLARTHIELAIASEAILADDVRATIHAEAALKVDPDLAAAHALLRRRKHGRANLPAMLAHLDRELAAASAEASIVELLAEKARLLEAMGDKGDAVRATWEQALAHAPQHAAALKGLESELVLRAGPSVDEPAPHEALAAHLARLADAYGSEPKLAAWMHVERAQILERRLGKPDAARAALERALALDEGTGPVRDAYVRHLAAHADWAALAKALDEEAGHETLDSRCAALELDAAVIADRRLGDDEWAVKLLERAMARAPTEAFLDRRVLDELVRLREARSEWHDAVRARRARLRFVGEPLLLAHELRALALLEEKLGDVDAAIADVQRAINVDASDPTLVETLDRLLAAAAKDEQRVALWLTEAARSDDGTKRARALGRAAQISENVLGRPVDAVRHLRSAWVAAPGDSEVLDALARLLAPRPTEPVDRDVRSLVELYTQAADHARDPGRRIAYLEKVALLWEELLGEPARAARVYEEILALDPDRRSAILGLERTSTRLGDARTLARALLEEARLSEDGGQKLALKTRAANALAKLDPARAFALVKDVLEHDPAHPAARALETRLNDEAGRWELAARSLYARIDIAPPQEKVALWLALAELQRSRLRAPLDALASLESARSLDPSHPVPPEEIAKLLEATGDWANLRPAIEALANSATSSDDRVRFLVQAAEIDELRLGDDAAAARVYQRALAEAPDNDLVADRLMRVLARRGKEAGAAGIGELATLLSKRIERATSPATALTLSFDLAILLGELGAEAPRAAALLESVLAEQSDHIPALRTLEVLRRRAGDWAPLARVLSKQGDALSDARARLGALWNLAFLEEWRLPVSDATSTYRRILDLDPTDPGALEATLRRDLPAARRGDAKSRRAVISALRPLVALASDHSTRLAIQLRLALILETAASEATDASQPSFAHEALERFRDALRIDELSVTAATGVARLANRLGDTEGAIAAATTLAELAVDTRVRARYLVDAAELLLGPDEDPRLGAPDERRERAATLLRKALESEPDSIAAAGRLATILLEDRQGDRLVVVFRDALVRAKSPDAIVMLGSEIARVARDELKDLTLAIDAMRRVRDMAPQHVPSLLTLAELCIAQRAWPEAVEALEAVVTTSREVPPRLTALFALASVYEKVLSRPDEVERVLRAALALDPSNARALRALLRRIAQAHAAENGATSVETKREVESLLARLAEVEKDSDQKSGILLELAEARLALDDPKGAEAALVEAVANSPSNARAFARLSTFYKQGPGPTRDHVGYARALSAVIGLGQQLGKLDSRWFAALGQLEVESLGRMRDGIVHLQRAVAMEPDLYETRYELASAFARMSANDDATRVLLGMLTPSPRPLLSIADPAAALELLERTLGAERRAEEAIVVSELRAIGGELDDGRHAWLRARRLPPYDSAHASALDRPTLVTHVLPPEGRHILLEVAAAVAGVEAKVLRADLSELGISSRDRVSSRSGHPTRAILDRLAKQLGLTELELVITPNVSRMRVLAQDVPWIVVPRTLTELPEPAQIASLGRGVARIAYGVPWLEELPPPHIEALLVAAARQVAPGYAQEDVDVLAGKLVAQYESGVARALSRRQKKLLEELAPHVTTPQGRLMPIEPFVAALARAELRTAYLLGGDLLAVIDELRAMDVGLHRATETPGQPALAAVLDHPYAGDVVRFALTPEATALRRRVGSAWTG